MAIFNSFLFVYQRVSTNIRSRNYYIPYIWCLIMIVNECLIYLLFIIMN